VFGLRSPGCFRFRGQSRRRLCCCCCCCASKGKQWLQGQVTDEPFILSRRLLLHVLPLVALLAPPFFFFTVVTAPHHLNSELPQIQLLRPAAAAPVVGWPPVRAFRRNLASASSKPSRDPPPSHRGNESASVGAGGKAVEGGNKGLFVKVNMDGVPIGRKLDLGGHAGYDTLTAAVDHLFRGLLSGACVRARASPRNHASFV
jgi:hypothetical protein